MRDIATGVEKQLTKDGVKDYGYATDNAGWTHSDHAIVVWSPDSKMIATFQQDQRKTGEMYTVSSRIGHPHLETWKYPLVGDKDVTMIERVIIDVDSSEGDAAEDAAGPASLHFVRQPGLRRPMGGCAVGRRCEDTGVCFYLARSQSGKHAYRGCGHWRSSRRVHRDRTDLLRKRL